jgi:hypothetical protein
MKDLTGKADIGVSSLSIRWREGKLGGFHRAAIRSDVATHLERGWTVDSNPEYIETVKQGWSIWT